MPYPPQSSHDQTTPETALEPQLNAIVGGTGNAHTIPGTVNSDGKPHPPYNLSDEAQAALGFISGNGGSLTSAERTRLITFVDSQVLSDNWSSVTWFQAYTLSDSIASRTNLIDGTLATDVTGTPIKTIDGYRMLEGDSLDTGHNNPNTDIDVWATFALGDHAGSTNFGTLVNNDSTSQWNIRRDGAVGVNGAVGVRLLSATEVTAPDMILAFDITHAERVSGGVEIFTNGVSVEGPTAAAFASGNSGDVILNRISSGDNFPMVVSLYASGEGALPDTASWNSEVQILMDFLRYDWSPEAIANSFNDIAQGGNFLFSTPPSGTPATDRTNIRAAIDAAALAGQRCVFTLTANYETSSFIDFPDDSWTDFNGSTIEVINPTGNWNWLREDNGGNDRRIRIDNLVIDGSNQLPRPHSFSNRNISFQDCEFIYLLNVTSNDALTHDIILENCGYSAVVNPITLRPGDDGVALLGGTHHTTVVNPFARDGDSTGGASYGVEIEDGCSFIDVFDADIADFENPNSGGILIDTNSSQAAQSNIRIIRPKVENCGELGGIRVNNSNTTAGVRTTNIEIDDAEVINSGEAGIQIRGNMGVSGVNIRRPRVDGHYVNKWHGIWIDGNCDDVNIEAPVISNVNRAGVYVSRDSGTGTFPTNIIVNGADITDWWLSEAGNWGAITFGYQATDTDLISAVISNNVARQTVEKDTIGFLMSFPNGSNAELSNWSLMDNSVDGITTDSNGVLYEPGGTGITVSGNTANGNPES